MSEQNINPDLPQIPEKPQITEKPQNFRLLLKLNDF
jgi:hypothetical protein